MRFNFIREGRRFFFITLVVKGRRCLLSRRVRDEIVEWLPAGRRVKDHWATSNKRDEAVTASNFVIMPDHVHLLLIVDFGKRPNFDILDWIMHFIRETGDCELWDEHLYFQLSFSLRQLKAIRRYIKMNPARAWWKESHRDMFIRRGGLRHEILDPEFPWTAFGNLTLLANPFLYPVRLTTKKTLSELEGEIDAAIEKARHGMVPVSGFLSPGEKETSLGSVPDEWCLRRRAQITEGKVYGGAAFVRRTAFQLGDCFKAKSVGTHGIVGLPVEAGASTHGWKLAEKLAKKLAGKVAA